MSNTKIIPSSIWRAHPYSAKLANFGEVQSEMVVSSYVSGRSGRLQTALYVQVIRRRRTSDVFQKVAEGEGRFPWLIIPLNNNISIQTCRRLAGNFPDVVRRSVSNRSQSFLYDFLFYNSAAHFKRSQKYYFSKGEITLTTDEVD